MSADGKIIKRTEFNPQESDIKNIIPSKEKSQEEIKVFLFEFIGMAIFAYGYTKNYSESSARAATMNILLFYFLPPSALPARFPVRTSIRP